MTEVIAHTRSEIIKMSLNKECPVCKQNGGFGKLRKFHINFEESITLCGNDQCTYPLGLVGTQDLIGKRKTQPKERPCAKKPDTTVPAAKAVSALQQKPGLNGLRSQLLKTPVQILNPKAFQENVSVPGCGFILPGYPSGLSKTDGVSTAGTDSQALQGYTLQHAVNGTNRVNGYTTKVASTQGKGTLQQNEKVQNFATPSITASFADSLANSKCNKTTSGSETCAYSTAHRTVPAKFECETKAENVGDTAVCDSGSSEVAPGNGPVVSDIQMSDATEKIEFENAEAVNDPLGISGQPPGLNEYVSKYTVTKNPGIRNEVLDKWFLQWENQDALCWLDVVLCLLGQTQSVRNTIDVSKMSIHSSVGGSRSSKGYIVRTLLAAYDQAMELSKSLNDQKEAQKPLPKIDKGENPESGGKPRNKYLQFSRPLTQDKEIIVDLAASEEAIDDADSKDCRVMNIKMTKLKVESGENLVPNRGVPLKTGAGHSQSPGYTSWAELLVSDADFLNARIVMNEVREQVWQELQPKLQCEKGRKDSPVFAIPLLLHSDPDICHLFKTTYKFETKCNRCENTKIERYTKVLPTLPKVAEDFSMYNVSHLRDCFYCRAPNQRRQLHFEKLAQCVMIHFVEGLPSSDLASLNFTLSGQSYQVTSVIQYKNDPSHFVIWIKHPSGEYWMQSDDLDGPLCRFEGRVPHLPAGQIHIVFWERVKGQTSLPVISGVDDVKSLARQTLDTGQPLTPSVRRKSSSSSVKDTCLNTSAELDRRGSESAALRQASVRESMQKNSEVSKSVAVNQGKDLQNKPAPRPAVRKTFALLKQITSRVTPSTKQSRNSAGSVQSAHSHTSRNTRKLSQEAGMISLNQSQKLKSEMNKFETSPQTNCVAMNAASKSLQLPFPKRSSTNESVAVFEGYKSKTSVAPVLQKMSGSNGNTSDVMACLNKRKNKIPSVSPLFTDNISNSVSAKSTAASTKAKSGSPSKITGKRKKSSPASISKKVRSSQAANGKSVPTCENLNSSKGSCSGVTQDSYFSSCNEEVRPQINSATDNQVNTSFSQSADQSLEETISEFVPVSSSDGEVHQDLASVAGNEVKTPCSQPERQSLEDIISELVPDVVPDLCEEIKGDNPGDGDHAQTEILKDLYKALDLNISLEYEEKKEVFQIPVPENSFDAWNTFDTLF